MPKVVRYAHRTRVDIEYVVLDASAHDETTDAEVTSE